jgi:Na+/serine symporter
MATLSILSTLIGAIFGTHFKVFILFPALVVVVALTIAVGFARGADPRYTLLTGLMCITGLQCGYLLGASVWRLGKQISMSGTKDVSTQVQDDLERAIKQLDNLVVEFAALSLSNQLPEQSASEPPKRAAPLR